MLLIFIWIHEALKAGNSAFLPPPRQLINWYRERYIGVAGLSDENTLYDMVMRYCTLRGLYNSAEAYPWQANAHYWMVTSLYNQMKPENLTEAELRKACRKELEKMSCCIHDGDSIPQPRAQLEKIYLPASADKAKAHIGTV